MSYQTISDSPVVKDERPDPLPAQRIYTRAEIAVAHLESLQYEVREEVAELGLNAYQQQTLIELVEVYVDHLINMLKDGLS